MGVIIVGISSPVKEFGSSFNFFANAGKAEIYRDASRSVDAYDIVISVQSNWRSQMTGKQTASRVGA